MDAVSLVRDEVRALVRSRVSTRSSTRSGPRPRRRGPGRVRRSRSSDASLPVLHEPAATARAVYEAVAGFGPLQRHLDDPEVEEIWVNEPGRVFVARHGRSELTTTVLGDVEVRELVERMLKRLRPPGRRQLAVRRRDAARRQPPARRHPRHHARATGR